MNARPHIAPSALALEGERMSVRVERVCALLDCDSSQVYRMIAAGELEAHGIGERGVRVYLDSVAGYRDRNRIEPKTRAGKKRQREASPPRSSASGKAHEAAVADLRARGLVS